MKGILKLIDVKSPVEGMKVIATDDSEGIRRDIGVVESIFQGNIWRIMLESNRILPYGLSELKQIVIEYKESVANKFTGSHFVNKTLPLHPDDWNWGIKHIGEEIQFETNWHNDGVSRPVLDEGIAKDYKGTWFAKIIHPAPITYTEEEVYEILKRLNEFPDTSDDLDFAILLSENELLDWWDKHKKK